MARDIDELLTALAAAPAAAAPDGLEAGVFARIREQREAASMSGGLRVQMAVAVGALALGVLVAGVSTPRQATRSEIVVLSEDAGLAPSVAIEGGA